ncbi:MAG: CPBP family intramembrane glutamic endopeptidase [Anaerolineae bacterium]
MPILQRLWHKVLHLCWNRGERRLRTLVRLVLTMLLLYLINLLLGLVWRWFGLEADAYRVWHYLKACFVIAIGLTLSSILLDRRRPAWFGRNALLDIGIGCFVGALAMTCLFLLALAAGWVRIQTTLWERPFSFAMVFGLLPTLMICLCVGFYEELLARGYLLPTLAHGLSFRKLAPRWPFTIAWLLTSIGFGLAHAWNPNASLLSTLIIIAAGLMLGLATILTGKLGLAVGIHIAWNFFQGAVFGFAVSGTRMGPSIITIRLTGPALWTGGAFGPEAGLLGAVAIIAATGMILGWSRWRYGRLAWLLDMTHS